jgi:hypothetical protein
VLSVSERRPFRVPLEAAGDGLLCGLAIGAGADAAQPTIGRRAGFVDIGVDVL